MGGLLGQESADMGISLSSITVYSSLSKKTWNKNPSPLLSSYMQEHLLNTAYLCPFKIQMLKTISNVMVFGGGGGPLGK